MVVVFIQLDRLINRSITGLTNLSIAGLTLRLDLADVGACNAGVLLRCLELISIGILRMNVI